MGVSGEPPRGQPFEEFKYKTLEQSFRNAWTDNADRLSLLYTGTPALKTDFTRTGKRSTAGAINDGKHSMIRYYINNFTDGYNCDCLDLSQGQISAKQQLNKRGFITPIKLAFAALMTSLILTRVFLNVYFPYTEASEESDSDSTKLMIFRTLVLIGVFVVGSLGIQANGRLFIDDSSRTI
uniref:Uncharacterized protein n=1 Tax=Favella ehrenbergii TaxID=182087 RepID=A0A7S3MPI2_9SPIT|mmetsp:Transcript_9187/g.12523  ORF Transcript_9187/g.12523 Transcript_9187/m.12523 type:complete len:181 (+) Transcript_9187:1396-1938(+)|eukprot:Macronucleus_4947.p1 GENE.Macronucleus_4947~~Macronucleus_4947.p1  ORF type:complete len:181 (+),score=47.70 Macronucleus_4947:1-543(+)